MSKSGLPLVKAADAEGISTSAAAMVSLGAPRGKAKRSAVFLGRLRSARPPKGALAEHPPEEIV